MAELIDKNEAKKMVSYGTYREDYVKVSDMDKLPNTTESEIRAKAIDEFAEKLKESLVKNYRHFITTDTDGFEWLTTDAVATHIDKVAEQLKEEQE